MGAQEVRINVTILFLLLTLIGVLGGMGIRMGSAFKEVEKGIEAMALLAAGFALGRGLASLASPRLALKRGSSVASLGFYGLGSVGLGYILLPFSYYPYLRVMQGIFSGIAWPSLQALVMALAPYDKRARISSAYFFFGTFGSSIAYAMGGLAPDLTLYVGTALLFFVALVLMITRINIVAKRQERRPPKKYLDVPLGTIFGSSLASGITMGIVDTEITVGIFYKMFGKVVGGTVLGITSGIGALLGYIFGKKLLDEEQSLKSLILPGTLTLFGTTLVLSSKELAPAGVVIARAALTWWRSANLALSKGTQMDLKVGLDNFGRNGGVVLASVMVSCMHCSLLVATMSFFYAISVAGFSSRLRRWRSHHL